MRKLLILLGRSHCSRPAAAAAGGSESKPLTKAEYQAKLEQTAKEIGDKVGKTQNDIDKMTDADLKQFTDVVHEFADKLEQDQPARQRLPASTSGWCRR